MQTKKFQVIRSCFVLLLFVFSNLLHATTDKDQQGSVGGLTCHFTYDSKGNPESFSRVFPVGVDESFLIGQMTVQVQTKLPTDSTLANDFILLNFYIWDDSGSELSNQPKFQAEDILVDANHPVSFQVQVRNLAVPDYPEVYRARCVSF